MTSHNLFWELIHLVDSTLHRVASDGALLSLVSFASAGSAVEIENGSIKKRLSQVSR